MFNMPGKGNPNMKFSMGAEQNPLAAFGGGTAPKGAMPTQGQMGAGGMNPMMLMSMLSGMNQDKGPASNIVNDPAGYQGGSGMPLPVQQTQQSPYQMAVMKALMGGLGA